MPIPPPTDSMPFEMYLVEALYNCIAFHGGTPFALVRSAMVVGNIPPELLEHPVMALNLSRDAALDLCFTPNLITASVRFSGRVTPIEFSPHAVIVVYDRDSGRGRSLAVDPTAMAGSQNNATAPGPSHLSIVADVSNEEPAVEPLSPAMQSAFRDAALETTPAPTPPSTATVLQFPKRT